MSKITTFQKYVGINIAWIFSEPLIVRISAEVFLTADYTDCADF